VAQRQNSRRWSLGWARATTAVLLLLPLVAQAASTVPMSGRDSQAEFTLTMGRYHEANAQWAQACECYESLLLQDRNQPEIRKRFLFCLRQCHRKFRQSDPSFILQVLDPQFKMSESLEFYKDVVRKLGDFYLQSDKVQLTRLFHEGLEELCLDLDDQEFCVRFCKPTAQINEIRDCRAQLKQKFGNVKINNVGEAIDQIRAVSREVYRKLELNGKLVVVEFASGACNALDEYSFYLTQSGLMTMPSGKTGLEAQLLEKGIGYVRIYNFDDNTVAGLEAVLQEFKMAGLDALLLDLRDNAGGSLEAAVQVVERFLPAPTAIASTSGKVNKTFQSFGMNVVDVPLFVLVDGGTASAAELVAGALKANKRGELIGQPTYGKSLIQKLVPVSTAPYGAIRLTWARFHLPKTEDLSSHGGLTPSIPAAGADEQLAIAIQRARALVPMR
jgi:Peptidase family S41